MNPSNIQPENLANISVDRHGEPDYPEAQSSGSSQHGIVPDGLGEVLEGTEDIDDQWNDREQNEESLALNQSQGGNYILQRWQRRGSFHHQCVGSGL